MGDGSMTGSFVGSPGGVFAHPRPVIGGKRGLSLSGAVSYVHRSGFSTSLQVNGEFRGGYSGYGVLGYVRYAF